jgi:cellobiose phosphorylase
MIAETILGNGDAAFSYYQRINPSYREAISEVHRCEPYVYAQTIAGRDAPTFGEAKNSWLTGTSAWNYVAITQHILGIRSGYDHLVVDPVIPTSWPGFTATRLFRGIRFKIEVVRGDNPGLYLDDVRLPGKHIPLDAVQGQTANVRVELAHE